MNKPAAVYEELATVLIVEDEQPARMALQAILEDLYEVVATADANQAERVLENQSIHILLTDYDMPGRSGIELITTVLDKYPHVVPILLTAYSSKREVRTVDQSRHVFAVLSKPYEPAALLRSLRLAVVTAQLRALQQKPHGRKGPV